MDWNGVRYFLAVARSGSTLAAARELGVNQTTVARRLSALEASVGLRLFDRRRAGCMITEAGAELLAAAERVEAEALAFGHQAGAARRRVAGVIRVTTNEGFANIIMVPALGAFRREHPDIRIDLIVDERRLDIARGAADVALRSGSTPTETGLVGRRLADIAYAAYCSRDYAERHGCPDSVESLNRHAVIGAEGPIENLPGWAWLSKAAPQAVIATRSSSITNLLSAVRAGLGVSVLPCAFADQDPGLVRCLGPIESARSGLWLLTRDSLRDVARVRAFVDFLAAHVVAMRRVLAGDAVSSRVGPPG